MLGVSICVVGEDDETIFIFFLSHFLDRMRTLLEKLKNDLGEKLCGYTVEFENRMQSDEIKNYFLLFEDASI